MMRLNCPSPAILPHILGLFLFFCLPLANAQTGVTVAGDAVSADDFAHIFKKNNRDSVVTPKRSMNTWICSSTARRAGRQGPRDGYGSFVRQ